MTPEQLMQRGIELMKTKNQDYTSGKSDMYENFRRQAELMSWFNNDIDKAFACMVAVKLARLGSLLGNKEPKHEAIEDTFIDLCNYGALWGGYHSPNFTSGSNQVKVGNVADLPPGLICVYCKGYIGIDDLYTRIGESRYVHQRCLETNSAKSSR